MPTDDRNRKRRQRRRRPRKPRKPARRKNTKVTGEHSEAAFHFKAIHLEFGVARPWGDSLRYDFILDNGVRLFRVQVKCTESLRAGAYEIEFARMNLEKRFFLTLEDLFEYLFNHPLFAETERKFDAVGRLKTLYSELSEGVHGRRVQDLEMRVSLNKIAFDQATFDRQASTTERCTESANFLLASFHREKVRRFQQEDRQIILRTMSPKARRAWTSLD